MDKQGPNVQHRELYSIPWEKNILEKDIWKNVYMCVGEGNGNPLQYYCLENPMDRGAW